VSQGFDLKGRLNLVEFNEPSLLSRLNSGYFAANNPGLSSEPTRTATVRQGYLEAANSSAVTEMVNLITAMRTFEANQRVAQLQDERTGRTIQELTA
jgi:flagellar basal-body rod protein FlgG